MEISTNAKRTAAQRKSQTNANQFEFITGILFSRRNTL